MTREQEALLPQTDGADREGTRITAVDERGEETAFYVLEETKINGAYYLLAAEEAEGDGSCCLLKDVSREQDGEAVYEMVQNEAEASYVLNIFRELMAESGIEIRE